jgi:hypothetical protein
VAFGTNGGHRNENDCVGSFDVAKTLGQAFDFFAVGDMPNEAFAALAEFTILSNFAGAGIDCVAVERKMETTVCVGFVGKRQLRGAHIVEEKCASVRSNMVE